MFQTGVDRVAKWLKTGAVPLPSRFAPATLSLSGPR
jgi:hypothetical protein